MFSWSNATSASRWILQYLQSFEIFVKCLIPEEKIYIFYVKFLSKLCNIVKYLSLVFKQKNSLK